LKLRIANFVNSPRLSRLGEHARGGQGFPVRYITPENVLRIRELLDRVSLEHLRQHWIPEAMETRGVYKFYGGRDEQDLNRLPKYFDALRQFYRDTAGRDEYVIVCVD